MKYEYRISWNDRSLLLIEMKVRNCFIIWNCY